MAAALFIVTAYLVVNLAIVIRIAHEESRGRVPSPRFVTLSRATRYGPPLAGVFYLITIAGDWPFFLFVVLFFGLGFYLLDRLLSFPEGPPPKR